MTPTSIPSDPARAKIVRANNLMQAIYLALEWASGAAQTADQQALVASGYDAGRELLRDVRVLLSERYCQ